MTDSARTSPLVSAIPLLAVFGVFILHAAKGPPAPVPATAPDTVFSAERAVRHVAALAERPHPVGSADHARVQGYLESQIRSHGLEPVLQATVGIGTRFPEVGRVTNVLARLPGRSPGGPAVLLVAHYDGVGAAPAAGDDGSGSSVLLETLRALRAGSQLEHDVIFLFTDGEEAGLLGAAAFVREHPWARDVRMILNFEGRGTGGEAVMFQTGPDNHDQIRVLRRLPNVSATSLSVTVYQFLPNDTDLSEFLDQGIPALNFAFIDGVARYHTSEDDAAHLDPGSVQQEGTLALALTREFGNGPLPRPGKGNAVFFTLPVIGLVVYPEKAAVPIAIVSVILTIIAIVRVARREERWLLGLVLGLLGMIVATAASGAAGFAAGIKGPDALLGAGARGIHGAGLVLGTVGIGLLLWALIRRWVGPGAAALGPLLVWTGLGAFASWRAPGLSFFVVWPAVAAAVAAIVGAPESAAARWVRWLPAIVTAAITVPVIYVMGLVALGIIGPGGILFAALASLVIWLVAPEVDLAAGRRRWLSGLVALGLGALLIGVARWAAKHDTGFPIRSLVAYAENAEDREGWLVTAAGYATPGSWNAEALGPRAVTIAPSDSVTTGGPPQWLTRLLGQPYPVTAAPTRWVGLDPPSITALRDVTIDGNRHLTLSIGALAGSNMVSVSAIGGTKVTAVSVDGRPVDPSKYRFRREPWGINYWAPADSGFTLELTLGPASPAAFEVVAQRPGLPSIPGRPIPPRPAPVVASQTGDFTAIVRRVAY